MSIQQIIKRYKTPLFFILDFNLFKETKRRLISIGIQSAIQATLQQYLFVINKTQILIIKSINLLDSYYQSTKAIKYMTKTKSQTQYNIVHGSFLLMNLIGFSWYFTEILNYHYLIKFFSVQAFELAILYSITSMIRSTRSSRVNQILYEISFTTNLIACLGYWIVVRPHVQNSIPYSFLLCNDFTHTMPILMLILIHYIERLEYFHIQNLKYQAYILIFAIIVNIFYTFLDKPVYPFMNYQDIGTAFFLIGGSILFVIIFLTMRKLSVWRTKLSKVQ